MSGKNTPLVILITLAVIDDGILRYWRLGRKTSA
jgi:hypothetical protein